MGTEGAGEGGGQEEEKEEEGQVHCIRTKISNKM